MALVGAPRVAGAKAAYETSSLSNNKGGAFRHPPLFRHPYADYGIWLIRLSIPSAEREVFRRLCANCRLLRQFAVQTSVGLFIGSVSLSRFRKRISELTHRSIGFATEKTCIPAWPIFTQTVGGQTAGDTTHWPTGSCFTRHSERMIAHATGLRSDFCHPVPAKRGTRALPPTSPPACESQGCSTSASSRTGCPACRGRCRPPAAASGRPPPA